MLFRKELSIIWESGEQVSGLVYLPGQCMVKSSIPEVTTFSKSEPDNMVALLSGILVATSIARYVEAPPLKGYSPQESCVISTPREHYNQHVHEHN